jgi:hypothetical protein
MPSRRTICGRKRPDFAGIFRVPTQVSTGVESGDIVLDKDNEGLA